jgi:ATP-dependent RNA helicase SUPV3L1/SUV3
MPMNRDVEFMAIDEVQLGTHRERGHVFTDRLLHARGTQETWFMGSETARRLVERLVPTAQVRSHPRLSRLRGRESLALSALPRRSAVVAFSSQRVYEIAERVRHKHKGAALVLGALSPRTRNAQVALYQSGEVDYLVATDAIGMGLNLDIAHVAFADVTKFDGKEARSLELTELAQVAGRAGRYLDDGTFGTLFPRPAFSRATVQALESHRFPAETQLYWRNSQLDFSNLDALLGSLREPPPRRELRPIEPAADHLALVALAARPEIRRLADTPERLALLWEICQIPDYPQLLFELHVSLLDTIFEQLTGPSQQLDADWIDGKLRRIDRVDGDIETLMGQIADIRTWNYISQRSEWVSARLALAERARDIEDRLSDALHEKLVARFIERKRLYATSLPSHPSRGSNGQKGHPFAQLLQMHSALVGDTGSAESAPSLWLEQLIDAPHEDLHLCCDGRIMYAGRGVGCLISGGDLLHPDVQVQIEQAPARGSSTRIQRRLLAFSRDMVAQLLSPLRRAALDEVSPAARGLVYQMEQGLGTVRTSECQSQLSQLTPRDRQLLVGQGIRFGRRFVYLPRLLDTEAIETRTGLVAPHLGSQRQAVAMLVSRASVANTRDLPIALLTAMGFVAVGPLIVRIDRFERTCVELENCARSISFNAPRDLPTRFGCDPTQIVPLLEAFGYVRRADGRWSSVRNRRAPSPKVHRRKAQRHSPTESNSEA